jgi:lipoprotein-anchoring transpeptidase ErfK/SrfK
MAGHVGAGVIIVLALLALTWVVATRNTGSSAATQQGPQALQTPPSTSAVTTPPAPAPTAPSTPASVVAQKPAINACAANTDDKRVLVSLAQQHVWLCAKHTVYADFIVTTGRSTGGDETPTGTYEVQALTRNTILNPDSGGAFHVKYWIPFKWGMFGFHDAPWQTIPFGSPEYRTQGSQGCVHMQTADIARLFSWVRLGTTVQVTAHSVT